MNSNYLKTLLFLVAFVSCTINAKRQLLRHTQERSLQMSGGFTNQSHIRSMQNFGMGILPRCFKGFHWYENYNSDVRYHSSGYCSPNFYACSNYNIKEGNCLLCWWGFKFIGDAQQGTYCVIEWYLTLIIIASVIGFLLLMFISARIFCCLVAYKYGKKQDGNIIQPVDL